MWPPRPNQLREHALLASFSRISRIKCVRIFTYCTPDRVTNYCTECYEAFRFDNVGPSSFHGWIEGTMKEYNCNHCHKDLIEFRPVNRCELCLRSYLHVYSSLKEEGFNLTGNIIILYDYEYNQLLDFGWSAEEEAVNEIPTEQ